MTEIPTPCREDIIALREQGMSREDIADYYHVSLSRVKRWITGLKIPGANCRRRRRRQYILVGKLDEGLTLIERSRNALGKRMSDDYRGYLLDGRPVRVDVLIRAAGLTIPDVP